MAVPSDAEDLIWFLRSNPEEIEGGMAEDDLLVEMAERLACRQGGIALIVRGSGGIEASAGIVLVRPLLARNYFLRMIWRIVAPEARMTGHAKSLLVAARGFADGIGRRLENVEYAPAIDSPTVRLCSRHLSVSGAVFSYVPAAAE